MSTDTRISGSDSWYLDPLVGRQKAEAFLALVDRWRDPQAAGPTLKTDLFEEANGEDALAPHLARRSLVIGIELDLRTARRAARRAQASLRAVVATDVRSIALRDRTVDLVVSSSTLDHFRSVSELERALAEIHRVLRPGGRAVILLDNPWNPLYHLLRLATPLVAPFALGRTLSRRRLVAALARAGLEPIGSDYAIHNPRGLATLLNLLLRAVLGGAADAPIRGLLRAFALLDRLPTRALTACFVAAGAVRPQNQRPTAEAPR